MAAAASGIDALVFTGGIGQHSSRIRAGICHRSAWLGIKLDEAVNERGVGPLISAPDSAVRVWVVPANEELMIALHTQRLIGK